MKKLSIALIIVMLPLLLKSQIISQYIETSSGTTPKGIEIWNNTTAVLDFASNILEIKKGTNGGAPSSDFTLNSGTLTVGAVLVIGTADLQTTTEANGATFYLETFTFNGDDALEVWYGTTKTDVFGIPGSDPGSSWLGNGVETRNQNISIKSGVTTGDTDGWTDPSTRFETTTTDNSPTGFGIAPVVTTGNTKPVITNITQTPANVTSSKTVSLSADVTDSDGTIDTVILFWGTVSGSLSNTIAMTLTTGDTYTATTNIPVQTNGTIIFYEIQAIDNEPDTSISVEQNYTVKDPTIVINEILADPDATNGDANGDGTVSTTQDEFVELVNVSSFAIDIGGYVLSDGAADRHVFPAGIIVQPGDVIVVFGGGTPTGFGSIAVQTASTGALGLNNGGDVVTLKNNSAVVVDTYSYGAEGGDNQSITREPDETGSFVKHSTAAGSGGALFSPGKKIDGSFFIVPTNNSPAINNIVHTPTVITSSNSVSVSADVTDSDGTIDTVILFWGTTSGSLSNTLAMELTTGDTYTATTNIPVQTNGTIIFYEIQAIDNEPDTSISVEQNYTVKDPTIVINEILADPDATNGDANGDGTVSTTQDEFVELVNVSSLAIDIGGYVLSDGAADRHVFPAGIIVQPGDVIVVFGGGTPTGFGSIAVQTASTGALGLNNGGDVVTSKNNSAVVVDTYSYGAEGGDNQSITREPDETGSFVKHSTAAGSGGALFSPGKKIDGSFFIVPTNNSPAINNIVHTPTVITSSNSVSVSADVTDSDGTIDTVILFWGTTSGSLSNTLAMELTTGDTYQTATPIPAQMNSTNVFYKIQTIDDFPDTTTSTEQTYTVNDPAIIINEIDVDQTSTDANEFIELYEGGAGNTALDGLVLVFYNGNGDVSYAAYDLDGYTTNANGYFVIGSITVPNVDWAAFTTNALQNGADAVALYIGNDTDFPSGTVLTTTGLIDAIIYDTDDADDTGLLTLLNAGQPQVNERGGGNGSAHSSQRIPNGTGGALNTDTYLQTDPTPGAENIVVLGNDSTLSDLQIDGTTIAGFHPDTIIYDTILLAGTTVAPLVSAFANDPLATIVIVQAATLPGTATVMVTAENGSSQLTYTVNFTVETTLIYGTPAAPTYDVIDPAVDVNAYYQKLCGLSGSQLFDTLQNIIVNSTTRGQTYGDAWVMLEEADENPNDPNEIWQIYSETGRDKMAHSGTVGSGTGWNREHIFPQSRGEFNDGTSNFSNGKDAYFSTTADDILHAYSDAHHLRAANELENTIRGDLDFDDVNGARTKNNDFYEPPASAKGDIARSLFYVAVRYNALNLVEGLGSGQSIGNLTSLLQWHLQDPPDDYEMNRNNIIEKWQNNRNPFIDRPDLAGYIFGDKKTFAYNCYLPSVDLIVSKNSTAEADAEVIKITVRSSEILTQNDTVTLNVLGTNITAGDYTLSETMLVIPSGKDSTTATFTIVDDTEKEGAEIAKLLISNPSSGIGIGIAAQNIAIADDDLQIALIISQIYENGGDKWIEITNTGPISIDLSSYNIALWSNAADTTGNPSSNEDLSGTLASGASILFRAGTTDEPGYAISQSVESNVANFNGTGSSSKPFTDIVGIRDAATGKLIDVFSWGTFNYEDKSFFRNENISTPNASFDINEWTAISTNNVKIAQSSETGYLGTHIFTIVILSSEKEILSFEIDGQRGIIDTLAQTIEIALPTGTTVTNLAPVIEISEQASINPVGETALDFTNPVTYTVTAEDGTTQDWTVQISLLNFPVVNISASTDAASEEAQTVITITVTAAEILTKEGSIELQMTGNNITAADYVLYSTIIAIPDGSNTATATLTIIDDTAIEGDETMTITLADPQTLTVDAINNSVEITITDNDFPKDYQSISFPDISREYQVGDTINLNAVSSSGLPVGYNILKGQAEVINGVLYIYGAGEIIVQAFQIGNDEYDSAIPITQTIIALSEGTYWVYPIPARDWLKVELSNETETTIDIYSIMGARVRSRVVTGTTEFDVSSLSSGVYILVISNNDFRVSKKVVIVR